MQSPLPLCLVLLLSACSLQQPPEAMVPQPDTAPLTRPFPADTLYTLLAAELAGHRGQEDLALVNYFQQAQQTRDPGVARQAALMARQLRAGPLAFEAAKLWADIEASNPEPHYLAGQYAIAMRQPDQALQYSETLLQLRSQTLFTPLAVSLRDSDATTRERFEQRFRALYSQHEDNVDLLIGIAILLEQQNRFAESLVLFRKAQSLDSENLPARLYEVDVLYRSGKQAKAIRRMGSIVADYQDNEQLRLQYARLLTEQDLAKARNEFDKLAANRPLDPDLLLARALVNFRLDDRKQARDLFEQLLFLKKHIDTAHYYIGELDVAEGKPEQAMEHFRRVEGGNEYMPAVIRTFDLMVSHNKRLEGQKWLMLQRERNPDLAEKLYLAEAEILMKHRDLPRSLAAMDEAITRMPGGTELYYTRSLVHEKLGNVAQAESDLRKVLADKPGNTDALNALGYLLADRTDRHQEAFGLISQALAQRPDDPAIIDSMGWVLYRLGKLDEAVLRLRQAYSLYAIDEVAAHLGEVLWVKGEREEASRIWQEALKQQPDSDIIRATRQRLGAP